MPVSNTSLPVFNQADALTRLLNDDGILRALVTNVLPMIPVSNRSLSEACQRGDYQQAEKIVHSFRGAAANTGAQRLTHHLCQFELHLKAGQTVEAGELLPVIEQNSQELIVSLNAYMQSETSPVA